MPGLGPGQSASCPAGGHDGFRQAAAPGGALIRGPVPGSSRGGTWAGRKPVRSAVSGQAGSPARSRAASPARRKPAPEPGSRTKVEHSYVICAVDRGPARSRAGSNWGLLPARDWRGQGLKSWKPPQQVPSKPS